MIKNIKNLEINGLILKAILLQNEHNLAFRSIGNDWYAFISDSHSVLVENDNLVKLQELLEESLIEPVGENFPNDYRPTGTLLDFCKKEKN